LPDFTLLTREQQAIAHLPAQGTVFLEGLAGSGKTTAAVERLRFLLEQGAPVETILILVPQRSLGAPYAAALRQPELQDCLGGAEILTMGGLAQRMVDLFWPLAAERAGFASPNRLPTFLTLEIAQYYMAFLVRPLIGQSYFESVVIDRNRLYSQILDNLNKAALVGFPHTEIGERLKSAWIGEPGQRRVYDQAQECGELFRRFCLEHNLLDFSLQMEVFRQHLWPQPICRKYLRERYRHLIYDNIEEDTPVAHDLAREWLPDFQSALLIFDHEAGYRIFLGADPDHAYTLKEACDTSIHFQRRFTSSSELRALGARFSRSMGRATGTEEPGVGSEDLSVADARAGLAYEPHHFHPEMVEWVVENITRLVVKEGAQPQEIAVLAPFLSDALRFGLATRLKEAGIAVRSQRPSRGLREEPATQCLITLAALAHPQWKIQPGKQDVAAMLVLAIEEMDLVRARLLSEIVYRVKNGRPTLSSFDRIQAEMRERITYRFHQPYETLRLWLEAYQQEPPWELDHFFSRLFGEVLTQPGFGFYHNLDAGAITARLIEAVRKFRWVTGVHLEAEGVSLGREYIRTVQDGIIPALAAEAWQDMLQRNAVLLAPAYTFLMNNQAVDYQFWLNVGGMGWWERLDQPLTHPYVLNRNWAGGRPWTDADEVAANNETLYRVTLGLLRRCRKQIFLGLSDLSEQGYEQQGPLLRAIQRTLRQLSGSRESSHV